MKTMIKSLLLLAFTGFVFTGCATHRCCKSQRWEYEYKFATTGNLQAELSEAGKDGWKLVTVVPHEGSTGIDYILERPKQ